MALLSLTTELLEAHFNLVDWKLHCQCCTPQLWPPPCDGSLLQHCAAGCNGPPLYALLLGCQAVLLEPGVQHIIQAHLRTSSVRLTAACMP